MSSFKSPISSGGRPQGAAVDPHEPSLLTEAPGLLNEHTPSSLHKTSSLMLEEKSSMRLRPELTVAHPGSSLDAPHFFMFPRPDQEVSATTSRMLPAAQRTSTQRTSQIVRGSESSGSFRGRRDYGQSSIDGEADGFLGSEHASGDFENATYLLKENLSPHLTPSLEAEVKARTQALEQEISRLRAQKLSFSQELNECEERLGQLEAERSRLEGDLETLMAALAEQKARAEEQQQRAQAAIREAQLKASATERRARFLITYSRNLLSSIAESTLTASRRHTASVTVGRSQSDDPRVSSQHLLNRSTDSCRSQSKFPHEEQPGENQTVFATPGSSFDEE